METKILTKQKGVDWIIYIVFAPIIVDQVCAFWEIYNIWPDHDPIKLIAICISTVIMLPIYLLICFKGRFQYSLKETVTVCKSSINFVTPL